jgi:hypothetical protein
VDDLGVGGKLIIISAVTQKGQLTNTSAAGRISYPSSSISRTIAAVISIYRNDIARLTRHPASIHLHKSRSLEVFQLFRDNPHRETIRIEIVRQAKPETVKNAALSIVQ